MTKIRITDGQLAGKARVPEDLIRSLQVGDVGMPVLTELEAKKYNANSRVRPSLYDLSVFPKVWYVSSVNGSDANDGTIGQPLATLQRAQTLAADGDGVFVKNGQYTVEAATLYASNRYPQWHLSKNLTWMAETPGGVEIRPGSQICRGIYAPAIFATAANVKLIGFLFDFSGIFHWGIVGNGASGGSTLPAYIEFSNCYFIGSAPATLTQLLFYVNSSAAGAVSQRYLNCVFEHPTANNGSVYRNGSSLVELINCCSVGRNIQANAALTLITCLQNVTTDAAYALTSGVWENAGTGENPDGTPAHIGVYGGTYAWRSSVVQPRVTPNAAVTNVVAPSYHPTGVAAIIDSNATGVVQNVVELTSTGVTIVATKAGIGPVTLPLRAAATVKYAVATRDGTGAGQVAEAANQTQHLDPTIALNGVTGAGTVGVAKALAVNITNAAWPITEVKYYSSISGLIATISGSVTPPGSITAGFSTSWTPAVDGTHAITAQIVDPVTGAVRTTAVVNVSVSVPPTASVTTRFIAVELLGCHSGNGTTINELQVWLTDGTQSTYTTTTTSGWESGPTTVGRTPLYWNSTVWMRSNLNDGATAYLDQNSTIFYGGGSSTNVGRVAIDLGALKEVSHVKLWVGQDASSDRRPTGIRVHGLNVSTMAAAETAIRQTTFNTATAAWTATTAVSAHPATNVFQLAAPAGWDLTRVDVGCVVDGARLTTNTTGQGALTGYGGAAALHKVAAGQRVRFHLRRVSGASLDPVFTFAPISSNETWVRALSQHSQNCAGWGPATSTQTLRGATATMTPNHTTLRSAFNSNSTIIVLEIDRTAAANYFRIFAGETKVAEASNTTQWGTGEFMVVMTDGNMGSTLTVDILQVEIF